MTSTRHTAISAYRSGIRPEARARALPLLLLINP